MDSDTYEDIGELYVHRAPRMMIMAESGWLGYYRCSLLDGASVRLRGGYNGQLILHFSLRCTLFTRHTG